MAAQPPPPDPVVPTEPPALARLACLDLVTQRGMRLVDPRDGRLGPFTHRFVLAAAAWTGPRAALVAFVEPLAPGALSAMAEEAGRWAERRISDQRAARCDVVLVVLGPAERIDPPSPRAGVNLAVVSVDPVSTSVTTVLGRPGDLVDLGNLRRHARALQDGAAAPTMAAIDLAERSALAGSRPGTRPQRFAAAPVVTYGLIVSWVLIWLAETVFGHDVQRPTLLDFGALVNPSEFPSSAQWWRLVSSAFLHATSHPNETGGGGSVYLLAHVFVNSWAMFNIGRMVEQLWGGVVTLAAFFLTAVVGGLTWLAAIQLGLTQSGVSLGASGGICGLVGLLFTLGRRQGRDVSPALAAALRGAALQSILATVVMGFLIPNVNNFAHVGGFAAGAALGLVVPPLASVGGRRLRRIELGIAAVVIAIGGLALALAGFNLAGAGG